MGGRHTDGLIWGSLTNSSRHHQPPCPSTHQVWQGTLMTVQPQARSRRRRIMVCPSGELVLTAKWKGPSTSMAILRSV